MPGELEVMVSHRVTILGSTVNSFFLFTSSKIIEKRKGSAVDR